uniref:Phosphoinositide phospholipase C n=1 Tax=Tetraselmis sp. GSL018 TaxID=582737 RepID=A0A061SJ09_9CHLO
MEGEPFGDEEEQLSDDEVALLEARAAEMAGSGSAKLPRLGKTLLRGSDGGSQRSSSVSSSQRDRRARTRSPKVVPELSSVIFLGNGPVNAVTEAWRLGKSEPDNFPANQLCSFSETQLASKQDEFRSRIVEFNKRHLSRVYPSAMRMDSSNFDPVPAWQLGCQLVALNFQTLDTPMRRNSVLFTLNGGCGYLLKPRPLRSEFPSEPSSSGSLRAVKLRVRVLCAINVPPNPHRGFRSSIVDPYVRLTILSPTGGRDRLKANTQVVRDNKNPVFDFRADFTVSEPEIALFSCQLKDNEADENFVVAYFVAPLTDLREGLRSLPMRDAKTNQLIDCSVVCEIKWLQKSEAASVESSFRSTAGEPLDMC